MPSRSLMLSEIPKNQLTYDPTKLEVGSWAELLPTDDTGRYSREKDARYHSTATIILPNQVMRGLQSLWSFEIKRDIELDEDDVELGTIKVQISSDNGISFYFWNGVVWAVAGVNDWNTELEIQDNIATFPFTVGTYKQIKVKVQIAPDSSMLYSPILYGVIIYGEFDFTPEEDVIKSLVEKINNNILIPTEVGFDLAGIGSSMPVNINCEVINVIGVWNITTDPGRLSNIYVSLTKTLTETRETGEKVYSQTIDFTAQPAGSKIIARLNIRVPIFIAPDADYALNQLPVIVIEVGNHVEDAIFIDNAKAIERNIPKIKARIRNQPKKYKMPITLLSFSADDLLTMEMNRGLNRLLKENIILSLATGENLQVLPEQDFVSRNIVREGLSVKAFVFSIIYADFNTDYEEVPLAIDVQLGTEVNEEPGD